MRQRYFCPGGLQRIDNIERDVLIDLEPNARVAVPVDAPTIRDPIHNR